MTYLFSEHRCNINKKLAKYCSFTEIIQTKKSLCWLGHIGEKQHKAQTNSETKISKALDCGKSHIKRLQDRLVNKLIIRGKYSR